MKQYRVRWTKRALRRLDEIGAHIAKDDPVAAERVIARIVGAVDGLAVHPAMAKTGRLKRRRELVLADISYIIPYRLEGDEV
jgi:plasmid stabilization system protein ParE